MAQNTGGQGPTIRLHLDPDRITWNDLIALDEWADSSERVRRDTLARFMVDEQQEPLPGEKARNVLGSLPLSQIVQVKDALDAALKEFHSAAVPPSSGGS